MTDHQKAINVVRQLLPPSGATKALIEMKVDLALRMLEAESPTFVAERDTLVRELESLCNVWVPSASSLEDNSDHQPWLEGRRSAVEWRFWARYKRYLEERSGLAPAALARLDESTEDILGRFEDPLRTGAWDRRGLVVGHVQSGKTANYTGVICKAIDSGYRLIIVLAGLHNSLRSQTQLRIDEGVIGFDTAKNLKFDQSNAKVGVGTLTASEFLIAHSFTNSTEKGDFSLSVAKNIGVTVGGADPVILVVKKNVSILRNLHSWATKIRQEVDPETGRSIVRGVPLLLIDDEADNASVDIKAAPRGEDGAPIDEYKPSAINGHIRKLLHSFEQSVYLGYTATPFANIFIDDQAATPNHGEDIYPRSFILHLPAPSTYIGAARVFGLREDSGAGVAAVDPLPIVRPIKDHESWIPDKHKKHHAPGALPASLARALRVFLLSCALRRARGQATAHNSMLVHVTRFTDVQALVTEQVRAEVGSLCRRVKYGDGAKTPTLMDELREIWDTDFLPTTAKMRMQPDLQDQVGNVPPWPTVKAQLLPAAERLEVRTINGTADDVLEYQRHPEGLSVIAIGGDKLSRGLTLEGLSVSYYLRASKMYDTLMQMGRWFGYRPGYLDACRLYTTEELASWYAAVAAANEELLGEFDYMAMTGATPKEFGLRVRNHPDGLLITARTKLRNSRKVMVSFAGTVSETIIFKTDDVSKARNLAAAESLLQDCAHLGKPARTRPNLWSGVPADAVLRFLRGYSAHEDAQKAVPSVICSYIESRLGATPAELTDWSVLAVSKPQTDDTVTVGPLELGAVVRAQFPSTSEEEDEKSLPSAGRYSIRRLVSPSDEWADLSFEEKDRASEIAKQLWAENDGPNSRSKEPEGPNGLATRRVRPTSRALLIVYPLREPGTASGSTPTIGFAISFPDSKNAQPVEYTVTNIYWEQEFAAE